MIDRDNVIGNLEQNIRWIEEIECHQFPGWGNVTMAMRDALELLKEQEPVPSGKRIKAGDVVLCFYECGHCKNAIRKPWEYCPFCGKAVKWDE